MEREAILVSAVQGGLVPPQRIIWECDDGTAPNLTDATVTGRLRNRATGAKRDVKGEIALTNPAGGEFLWLYHADDVAEAGSFDVQFTAAWLAPTASPAKTYKARWTVEESLD